MSVVIIKGKHNKAEVEISIDILRIKLEVRMMQIVL